MNSHECALAVYLLPNSLCEAKRLIEEWVYNEGHFQPPHPYFCVNRHGQCHSYVSVGKMDLGIMTLQTQLNENYRHRSRHCSQHKVV